MPRWSLQVVPSVKTEIPRILFRERLKRRYLGWDDAIDRRFDHHSVSLLLYEQGSADPSAVCRLIMRQWCGRTYALPMELGDLAGCKVPQPHPAACEASGLVFTSLAAAEELALHIALWAIEHDVTQVYALYDPSVAAPRTFYLEGAGMHTIPDAQVAYSSFRHRETQEPVWWHVAAGDPTADGARLLSRARARAAADEPGSPMTGLRSHLQRA